MVNSVQFSKRLQKILDYYGVSATAFAEILSFNRSTISHLLSGRNKPSLEFVMKVLEAYPEVELYWLLNGKGTFPSTSKNDIPTNSKVEQNETKTILENQKRNEIQVSEEKTNRIQTNKENIETSKTPVFKISEEKSTNKAAVDRIVIFYKDGTFSEFKND